MKTTFFKAVIEKLSEGIIIMDEDRNIIFMNEQAELITGWEYGQRVPYCSYCQMRFVGPGEERCILATENSLPSFRSYMLTGINEDTEFEMTLDKITIDGTVFQVLIIRDPNLKRQEKTIRTQELLIHETMLAQENERKRIARELHDHIGQNIYSIFLGLDSMKHHVKQPEYYERLEKLTDVMEKTLNCLKRLTKDIHPRIFDSLDFETGLSSALKDWEQLYELQITFETDFEKGTHINKEASLHLYRIMQEAVHNAKKHGNATVVNITMCTVPDRRLRFIVKDNGVGFDTKKINPHGLGLKHMRERVKMLQGDIQYTSQIGGPTIIEGYISLGGD